MEPCVKEEQEVKEEMEQELGLEQEHCRTELIGRIQIEQKNRQTSTHFLNKINIKETFNVISSEH